ncbi:1714_t:CDS:2, partial [Funneliformis geosporum]
RKTLQKRRARENETQNERETHLVRNREYKQQKREKENAEENEARLERRTYLNNLNQNLNSQQRQLQQKTGQSNCGVNIRDKPSPADELNNGWNELNHTRVQPPTSLGLEVNILQKYADLVLQKHSSYLRDWTIEEKNSLGCLLCKRIHDKDHDEHREVFECDPSIAEKIQQENKKSLQCFQRKSKVLGFPKAFVNFSSWAKYNESLSATEIYEQRYVRPLPNEGDIYVGSPWETGKTYVLEHITISDDVNLLVLSTRYSYSNTVTTRLNLKSYCDIDGNINLPDHKRVPQKDKTFRLASNKEIILTKLWDWAKHTSSLPFENRINVSLICHLRKDVQGIIRALKTDFPELRIKEYHGKSDPVKKAHDFRNIEESWKDVDLVAYTSTLKIGNRGIFSDIDSIIRNKDVSTIRLWVAYMLEKFSSRCLFGWRMVDFLKEVGMIISIIESDPKSNKNTLLQVVKAKCSVVKTDKISDITNANILDRETAEFLENKSRKTLEEMCSLDQHHIVDCYGISPESLTEDFILKYGNFNHMK